MIAKYPNPPGGALNEVIVRHFLKQLSSALKFLRDRNLIHRDIKPQNLLLCPSPSSYRAGVANIVPYKGSEDSYSPTTGLESLPLLKIADFGFARSLPATSMAETLCGSPLYMAPEILRYEKYDAKADLWSVGTVLYEMMVGKPPFRAANHVDLLRRIEKAEDRIKFPEDNPASAEMKQLIRALLKRNPVARMTFPDFFENDIVKGSIPGVVSDDQPSERRTASADPDALIASKPDSHTVHDAPVEETVERGVTPPTRREYSPTTRRPTTPHQTTGTPPTPETMRRMGSRDKPPLSGKDQQRTSVPYQRPSAVTYTSSPGRQEHMDRNATTAAMERQRSRNTTGSKNFDRPADVARDERERAAQDVAFERDYVLVEKRAVEVNAFADELAHSPRIHGRLPKPGQVGAPSREATAQGARAPTPTSPTATKAMQVASGRPRADSAHSRQSSYERRYGQSPTSATSAISKALNMASGRLFGVGFSPPVSVAKGARSPPLGYNAFPAYPINQGNPMLLGDGAKIPLPLDEDAKAVQVIEECATRSDVVYGFAEVKYKQLIPLAPSVQTDTPVKPNVPGGGQESGDGGLTVDAIVTLSEEALVLYVKSLALLAKSMDVAGAWWTRKNRETFGEPSLSKGDASALAGTRINNVVQWVRSRFNEVLEKAEFVRMKLIEGQKRLPADHPSHPSNHSVSGSAGAGMPSDVVVSSGVTAEKLMYDRALEMSRAAAINELTGEDLVGCEIAYVTAIRMLEAVLEDDESQPSGQDSPAEKGEPERDREKVMLDGVQVEDRQVVEKRKYPWATKRSVVNSNVLRSRIQHSQPVNVSPQETCSSRKATSGEGSFWETAFKFVSGFSGRGRDATQMRCSIRGTNKSKGLYLGRSPIRRLLFLHLINTYNK